MQTLNALTIEETQARLESLIADNPQGEDLLITTDEGQLAAKFTILVREPYRMKNPWKLIGSMKGQIELLPGWDDPLEGLEPYMK